MSKKKTIGEVAGPGSSAPMVADAAEGASAAKALVPASTDDQLSRMRRTSASLSAAPRIA